LLTKPDFQDLQKHHSHNYRYTTLLLIINAFPWSTE
jgi:hypothetical protein